MTEITIELEDSIAEFALRMGNERYDGCPACFITFLIRVYREEFEG